MPTLQDLRTKRANVWSRMTDLMAGEMDAEARKAYDAAEVELDDIGDQIERGERHERQQALMATDLTVDRSQVVAAAGAPTGSAAGATGRTDDDDPEVRYAKVFGRFMRSGASDLEGEDRRALQAGFNAELRAQGVGTNTAGGYTVPQEYRQEIVQTMKTFGGMLDAAEVITTTTGANLQWPTNDDTANVGAILAENTQITEQDLTLNTNSIDSYMYTSKLVRVSVQLLQDSAFDLEAWLRVRLGERVGRILNAHFTTGTGTSQPDGLVTGTPIGKTGAAGQVATVTYDDLIDLIDSIDPAYQGNAEFMMSQTARKVIRKLKDGNNLPLWQPSVQAGVPDQLLGYGYRINQDLPVPAASAKSILFGDYKMAYLIRLVTDMSLLRLAERYADFLQVAFALFQRADGTVQNTSAVRAYAHPAA